MCMHRRYNRIRIVLAELDRRPSWLAEELDVDKGTVSKWCSNKSQPHVAMLYRIAEVLDVEVRELLVASKE